MLIVRDDPITHERHTRDIPITAEELARWKAGAPIQTVVPHLSADDREFILSGIMPSTWYALFGHEAPEPIIKGHSVPE